VAGEAAFAASEPACQSKGMDIRDRNSFSGRKGAARPERASATLRSAIRRSSDTNSSTCNLQPSTGNESEARGRETSVGPGHERIASSGRGVGPRASVCSAAGERAESAITLGLLFKAWDNFAELASDSDSAFRAGLHHSARVGPFKGDEPFKAILARSRPALS